MRLVLGLSLLALSACGDGLSGDARGVRDMCVSNGGETPYCTCIATTLEKQMPAETFKGMAQGDEEADIGTLLDQIGTANSSCGAEQKTGG